MKQHDVGDRSQDVLLPVCFFAIYLLVQCETRWKEIRTSRYATIVSYVILLSVRQHHFVLRNGTVCSLMGIVQTILMCNCWNTHNCNRHKRVCAGVSDIFSESHPPQGLPPCKTPPAA